MFSALACRCNVRTAACLIRHQILRTKNVAVRSASASTVVVVLSGCWWRTGSRTEQCDQCGRWVQLKDLGLHRDSSCLFPEPSTRAAADPAASSAPPVQADDEVSSVSQTLSGMTEHAEVGRDEACLLTVISSAQPAGGRAAGRVGTGPHGTNQRLEPYCSPWGTLFLH